MVQKSDSRRFMHQLTTVLLTVKPHLDLGSGQVMLRKSGRNMDEITLHKVVYLHRIWVVNPLARWSHSHQTNNITSADESQK